MKTDSTIEAYPLHWPVAYPRTDQNKKQHAQFKTNFAQARDTTVKELQNMRAKDIIISSNVPLKRDGLPYAVPFGKTNVVDDNGIAVYFNLKSEQKVIACDAFLTLDDNMQAIAKTIEALRGIERWKCSDIINQTFSGFKALPESTQGEQWVWEQLGLPGKPATEPELHMAYRKQVKKVHPDTGGTAEALQDLISAYKTAQKLMTS